MAVPRLQALLQSVLPPYRHAFAYGSGVFDQPGLYDSSKPAGLAAGQLIDFIVVVDDTMSWHAQNLVRNRHHYSFLGVFGPQLVDTASRHVGVGVYYNTLVPVGKQYIKYGVVGRDAFLRDLSNWEHLYVAGRLQKPVQSLQGTCPDDTQIASALQLNLQSALSAGLLLSSRTSSLKDLFKRVTALSYQGDIRAGIAEDSKKVERIVAGSYQQFEDLYLPQLKAKRLSELGVQQVGRHTVQQEVDQEMRALMLSRLPKALLRHMASSSQFQTGKVIELDSQAQRLDLAQAVVRSGDYQPLLLAALRAIVGRSSRRQALLGFLSAGPSKSLQYLGRKMLKAWRSYNS